jgi:hypothetical protein
MGPEGSEPEKKRGRWCWRPEGRLGGRDEERCHDEEDAQNFFFIYQTHAEDIKSK